MEKILTLENVSKSYARKQVVDQVNLTMGKGEVLGILGPNGSGKTTIMKMIAGLVHPDQGNILICGHKPGPISKSLTSFLPDTGFMYENFSLQNGIDLFQDFFTDFDRERAQQLMDFMELKGSSYLSTLSKGMQERYHLVLILARRAALYILDEPIAGVDPLAREQILTAIIENMQPESSMLITTHLIHDMERLFDRVAFLKEGKIILEGDADELRKTHSAQIEELYKNVMGKGDWHA